MTQNRHGLSRTIPDAVKRAVRERCGFGCIVCGAIPYEYDHFRVPFVDVTEHDPDDIVLLCDKHHREKTKGLVDVEWIAKASRIAPLDRVAHFRLGGTHADFGVHWPAIEVEPQMHGVVVDGQPVLQLELFADELEPVKLSGVFCDRNGHELCRIKQNEITVRPSNIGDFFLSANRFTFKDSHRKTALSFALNTRGLEIREIAHVRNGVMVQGNASGLWVCNGVRTVHARDIKVSGCYAVVDAYSRSVRDYTNDDISKYSALSLQNMTLQGGRAAILLA